MIKYSINDEIQDLLTKVNHYFHSLKHLLGDDIYLDYDPSELALTSNERKKDQLTALFYEIRDCQKCELATHRTKLVFGYGNSNPAFMLIGEAPGFYEDREGIPFVGKAGQLLDKILKAIQLSREDVYITNVVKCRPPNNRDPLPEECQACNFILRRQIEIIKPQFILILGRIAAGVLLNTEDSISTLRGKVYEIFNSRAVVTYHPAALLRNQGLKRNTWEDVQLLQSLYKKNMV